MAPRWSWDFEDERKRRTPAPAPPAPVAPPAPAPRARRPHPVHVRRRRGAAGLVLLALALLAIAAVSSGSHGASKSHAHAAVVRPPVPPPSDSEADQLSAVRRVLGYTPFVREGGAGKREVALTFDDGPGPYTPQVLSVLERLHVKATFFVVGKMLRYFSASAVREIEDGDAIGDHTESHPMLAQLSPHDQREELFEQIARVELLGGHRPVLFRPPYGSFDTTTLRLLRSLHLLMVLWSVDTSDYQQPGVAAIVQRALEGAHPGAIILMHDGGGTRTETIEALPAIVDGLRERGYRLVTVPQLMADNPPPSGQPLPSGLAGD